MRRIGFTRFSRWGDNLGRLTVSAATHTDALDGTDELNITCAEDLVKGDRIVWIDLQGVCHEHIVDAIDRTHDSGGAPETQASCINSIAETWDDWLDDKRPSGSVSVALASILAGTRWEVGTCDQDGEASRTFYHESVREGLAGIIETWGGELETLIAHDGSGISSRRVGVRAKRGNQSSAKRFTWTKDLVSVKRSVASDNPKTRVYGYGKGVETEGGGYGRRLTFGDINDGKDYVEDIEAASVWGHPDGKGGVLPAVASYVNEQCEDAVQLLRETKVYLDHVKDPKVTYTASVIDLYAFGRSWEGVGVGDAVAIIDRGFSDEGVRLRGRVSQIERDLLTGDVVVTFGTLTDAMADMWQGVSSALKSASQRNALYDAAASTSDSWLRQLQAALNAQFNAAGTYRVETFELGTMWSNVPLDADTGLPVTPTSGMWAVNISGAGMRLAANLTSDGQWDWRTFLTGAMVSADCITTGTIDASQVSIKNLLRIGDDNDGVMVGSNRVSFSVNGETDAMHLESIPFTINELYQYNDDGTALYTSNKEQSGKQVYWFSIDTEPYIEDIDGADAIFIAATATAYIEGESVIVSNSGYVNPHQPNEALSYNDRFHLSVLANEKSLSCSIIMENGGSTDGMIYTLSISYRSARPSGEIALGDGSSFINTSNLPSVLNGGDTFSGQICIPFIYGNTMRNYNMYFRNGILVDHKILTPSDPGFRS